ncbi:hypothetical protein LCGC14_2902140 [marine sediment metagenome]|uniref:Uncharacterized protein n=1 Tax=marine sediment metagenome TaxID=412755 RepID=A0A0F9AK75_9ZZZZ
MDKIREQIKQLQMIQMLDSGVFALTQDNCKELVGSMEAMLKVVEVAEKISIANSWDVHHKIIAELRDTITNLKGEGE